MTQRIFRSMCLVAILVLLAALVLTFGAMYSYFTSVQSAQLRIETALAAHAVGNEGLSYFDELDDTMDCRITWIDSDGTVLYDNRSDSGTMENHLEREEVRNALLSGYGQSSRYSSTLMQQYIYAAERLPDGTVLRLSTSRNSVLNLMLEMSGDLILIILVTVLLSLLLAKRLSRRIVQPLNELDLDHPMSGSTYEEVTPLLRRIESQQRQLQSQTAELNRRRREFDAVTGNMNEGLVLTNAQHHVLTMNMAAARIMGLVRPYTGINFLTLNHAEKTQPLLDAAMLGRHGEQSVFIDNVVYQFVASPVKSGGQVSGVVLLILDITEKQRSEAQRREFTANVSHELKTPLHAISGYAELLKSGIVSPEDVPGFSGKIHTEAQRMTRLIEDILRLSRLDEMGMLQPEPVDLYGIAADVLRELETSAREHQVTLALAGDSCPMESVPHLLRTILTNLTTNSIKYNRPGGSVRVEIRSDEEETVLTVADTGIGIEPEHQERIFERFYRVDKSHSKAVGGTGLGLSIVKHAAVNLGARIDLQSTPGEGTSIGVHFPKKL